MSGAERLHDVLRRFAATMARSFEVDEVLYELGDNIVAVLDAAGAGISVAADSGRLRFVTATSEAVVDIARVQEEHQAGPCVEAFRSATASIVPDISALDRWPEYRLVAKRNGFRSVVGLPLSVDGRRVGSLDVYDIRERDWTTDDLADAETLADVATAYLLRAGELEEARRERAQLQRALDSRVIIEQAKGMLAREHDLSVDDAFELLRAHSRRNRVPVRRVAHAVVELSLQLPAPMAS